MNTLEYMKSIGIKGELEITLEQRARLVKEGVRFSRSCYWDDDGGLTLICTGAKELENAIKKAIGTDETWFIHDIWTWTYLENEYLVGIDGGVHFTGLTIYWAGEV